MKNSYSVLILAATISTAALSFAQTKIAAVKPLGGIVQKREAPVKSAMQINGMAGQVCADTVCRPFKVPESVATANAIHEMYFV